MTKSEAQAALEEGKKITHRYFEPEEFIEKAGNNLRDEAGLLFSSDEFWKERLAKHFDDGWDIFSEVPAIK